MDFPSCQLCLDRPGDLFNGIVDDPVPITECPVCKKPTGRTDNTQAHVAARFAMTVPRPLELDAES